MSKVVTPEFAVEQIKDGQCVGWTTAGLCGFPEQVATALEERWLNTGSPKNIMLTHSCGCGDHKTRGMNHFGYEGLVRKIISGHIGEAPKLGKLVIDNKIEAHLIPQGVMVHLYRQMAGKKPGLLTKVGLGTYADPRQQGCKVSEMTKDEVVKLVELDGEEYLYYKPYDIDVAVIRGSICDEDGNMTMGRECLNLEAFHLASIVKNTGGIVIAQVEQVCQAKTLNPKDVKVPGVLVDYIVVAKPEHHLQTKVTYYSPALCGDLRLPMSGVAPLPLDERKVIARRACMELKPGSTLNLGIGMPDGVGNVASEEGVLQMMTMTTELGNFGGMPQRGPDFPSTWNPDCTVEHANMFDFYDGGGLAMAVLGMAQVDNLGNVNVSKFGPKVVGPGGFVNISSAARKVVFVGTLTASEEEYSFNDGKIQIVKEGKIKKFINKVDHVTFSGPYSAKRGQEIYYVTERAVFYLDKGELTLIEVAPGMDVEKDVLSQMEFRPKISPDLKEMNPDIFQPTWGKLKDLITK